jgi:hypothetical protein
MLKRIIKLANKLDNLGLTHEADTLDKFLKTSGWKILDTMEDGSASLVLKNPLDTMKFRVNYVLDRIFDNDYQFGSGGDMSDMPEETRDILKRYAISACSNGTFNVNDFFQKILSRYKQIELAADTYTFNAIKNDLAEIVAIQARYISATRHSATPSPAKFDPKSVAEKMSGRFEGAPAASIKPMAPKKHDPSALFEAVESLPSDSSLPSGVEGQVYTPPQRMPR